MASCDNELSLEMETIEVTLGKENMEVMRGRKDKNGVYLTWEDLWVTVRDKEGNNSKAILEGVTGYARPARLLAIMGPSGCGKSTLLDALAGRLDSSTRQSGEILVNGHKQALAYGTSAYVTDQDETLMSTLTVRETVYYSSELQLPASMSKSEKRERAEECIREMGLQLAMDTRVGGRGVKGLSGGQKRRLSICIEILTRPKLLFLDEPTSGLDTAASYYVMSRIARAYCKDGRTIIASIHQPSSQVFMLFDDLCLMSSGRTVYFGTTKEANEFFGSNGFPCPSLQSPSDHFLQMINKDFDENEDIEQGVSTTKSTEEVVSVMVESYKSSQTYQQVRAIISAICEENGDHESLDARTENANFLTQCQVLTRRSFVNMYRDLGYYWLRLVVYIILAVALGTIFFDLKSRPNAIPERGALLMFVAGFLTFMTIGGFPSFIEDMKVFIRERLNGHYGTIAFVIGNTLSAMPYLLLVSLIPGTVSYYLAGLESGYQHFLYFILVIFACMLLVESMLMVVASLVPNFLMGIISGSGILGLMMLGAGFFCLPKDLPRIFWRYPLYYISFHKYAFQGLVKNEFEGAINGDTILNGIWQIEADYSKWVDLGVLFGMAFLYRLMFFMIVKTSENIKPTIRAFTMRAPRQIIQVDI